MIAFGILSVMHVSNQQNAVHVQLYTLNLLNHWIDRFFSMRNIECMYALYVHVGILINNPSTLCVNLFFRNMNNDFGSCCDIVRSIVIMFSIYISTVLKIIKCSLFLLKIIDV